jgi:hypothetical protein
MKKLVVSFEDELDSETIDSLFEEISEGGAEFIESFDDNCKVLFAVPSEIVEVENYEPTEYWKDVINETMNSCCDPKTYNNPIGVYSVRTIEDFRKNDLDINPNTDGGYSFLDNYLSD